MPAEHQERLFHAIAPVYDPHSRILILGSFPSVKSRQQMFFYGHPQNRFWPLLALLLDEPVPAHGDIPAKRAMLLKHRVALWDTIASCQIEGSSDVSIRQAQANDLDIILQAAPIQKIFLNGSRSGALFRAQILPHITLPYQILPSTSPANAAWTLQKLCDAWQVILPHLT